MNTDIDDKQQIICIFCGSLRPIYLKTINICQTCYRKQSSTRCNRCGRVTHYIEKPSGLCPKCVSINVRPQGTCSRCNRVTVIFNQLDWLCKTCHNTILQRQTKKVKQNKRKCTICGQIRSSALVCEAICQTCWAKKHNGLRSCAGCSRVKVIFNKSSDLCKHCYHNHIAPRALRTYVDNYTTIYPYNKTLFLLLVNSINWELVTDKTNQRFRVFGKFLQSHQLPQPLTWESIDESLPVLGLTNRTIPKHIRSCLFELGHLLAASSQMTSWDVYVARRNALLPIIKAPEHIQPLLHQYVSWLWEQQYRPRGARGHLDVLAAFWSWCDELGISSPEQVQDLLINDYLLTLHEQWQCSVCQSTAAFNPANRKPPLVCVCCGVFKELRQVERYSPATVSWHRSGLLVFFDWCKLNRMVMFNPVCRQVKRPDQTISHYSLEVIQQLCDYIKDSNADPTEALVLYLIIFHGLSTQELRFAQLPCVIALREEIPVQTLVEAYYLVLPKPIPSRGLRTSGRFDNLLLFPSQAAMWFKPLLQRFLEQRQQRLKGSTNQYLLVAPGQALHKKPVSQKTIQRIVRQASLRVLGVTCYPKVLRSTAGVIFTDRAGVGILSRMGWGDQQAFAYGYAQRQTVRPHGYSVR